MQPVPGSFGRDGRTVALSVQVEQRVFALGIARGVSDVSNGETELREKLFDQGLRLVLVSSRRAAYAGGEMLPERAVLPAAAARVFHAPVLHIEWGQ